MRFSITHVLVAGLALSAACDPKGATDTSTSIVEKPLWVGTYTLSADSSRHCVEIQDPAGRHCNCDPPGHYEGSLVLDADSAGNPTGTATLRDCQPGVPCASNEVFSVTSYSSPTPPGGPFPWMTSKDTLNFCAGFCPYGGNGGISFVRAGKPWTTLTGYYWRNQHVRGCGDDYGPFTATRQ